MTTIKTYNNIELVIVEVPEDFSLQKYGALDARNNCIWGKSNGKTYTVPLDEKVLSIPYDDIGIKPKILGKLSELSEDVCKKYVEGFFKHNLSQNYDCWRNYFNPTIITYSKTTAKESLISLLQTQGIDTTKNLLLLKNIS